MSRLWLVSMMVVVSACAELTADNSGSLSCSEPRPQMCTREYNPVCGATEQGEKTYGNACSACADSNVKNYQLGACTNENTLVM
jgi:cytochrome c5